MTFIEMLNAQIHRQGISAPNMYAYTHQDDMVATAIHNALVGMLDLGATAEDILLAGMTFALVAIREAGELPDDLATLGTAGEEQDEHDATARRLLEGVSNAGLPWGPHDDSPCPDCGQARHPDACEEPDILSPDG